MVRFGQIETETLVAAILRPDQEVKIGDVLVSVLSLNGMAFKPIGRGIASMFNENGPQGVAWVDPELEVDDLIHVDQPLPRYFPKRAFSCAA